MQVLYSINLSHFLHRSSLPQVAIFCSCTSMYLLLNPRRACAARVTVVVLFLLSVRPSVCCHVFCHCAYHGGQEAIPTGSALHRLDFKCGDLGENTAFKSYGMKTKWTSQSANEFELAAGGFRRSTMHGDYLMDNWWTKRCLKSRLQRQTARKKRENLQALDRWGFFYLTDIFRSYHRHSSAKFELVVHVCYYSLKIGILWGQLPLTHTVRIRILYICM